MTTKPPKKITDKARMDFLEACLAKATHTGKCVFRWSKKGRGFRLHETNILPAHSSVRDCLDDVIESTGFGGD